jgi:AcrR family transcriptional regulator
MKIRVARKPDDAYQHGNLREALIQAGLKLLSEGGVEKLSLRAAAQLAGVSHAAPYRHFRDKNALVAAIAEQGYRLLTARMQEEEKRVTSGDLRARLTAIGVGYVAFAIEHPGYFRVIFGGLACADAVTPELKAAGAASYQVLRGLIDEGVAGGVLRAEDPDELALAAWSLVHGLGMLAIDGALAPRIAGAGAFKRMAERLTILLQEGLLPRAAGA